MRVDKAKGYVNVSKSILVSITKDYIEKSYMKIDMSLDKDK
jgi:hypothetical protein